MGKKVYMPDGSFQGEVLDTGFVLGSGDPLLIVKTGPTGAVEIPWGKIAAARDILILAGGFDISKAKQIQLAQAESQSPSPSPADTGKPKFSIPVGRILGRGGKERGSVMCPTCGKPASWIKQYGRWYCYQDKKYI